MAKVTAFLGRKLADASGNDEAPGSESRTESGNANTGFIDMGARLGKEHEALRSLLDDAARRINSLDLVKEAYGKLAEPIGKVVQALEQEKLHNAALQSLLNGLTEAHDKQRTELTNVKQRAGSLEVSNATLRSDLDRMQEQLHSMESERLQMVDELTAKRERVTGLERQLAQETAECRRLAEDCGAMSLQLEEGQNRVAHAEAVAAEASEKGALAEAELRSLRQSLEETLAESARLSRRLTELGSELAVANAEIAKLDTAVTAVTADRDRLATELEDVNNQRQAESHSLNIRFEALQSRALSAEKLLGEARQSLAVRNEEVRRLDRSNAEITEELNDAHKKLEEQEVTVSMLEGTLRESEQNREAMAERNSGLARTLRERETALAHAMDNVQSLTDRLARLEADMEERVAAYEKRLETLNVALQRERMERSMVEGALETARHDYAVLHHDYSVLTGDAPGEKRSAVG